MQRRFFYESITFPSVGETLVLSSNLYADEIKHILKVLRLQMGDTILLSNGRGTEAQASIKGGDKNSLTLEILSVTQTQERKQKVYLAQALLKGPKMDWLVEKLTELGVQELQIILSEYCQAQEENAAKREDRWLRISKSALKQSGNSRYLSFQAPCPLKDWQALPHAWKIALHLEDGLPALASAIKGATKQQDILLAVGPEGGWSERDLSLLREKGFHFAHMGKNILRGETAAIVASAIALHTIDFTV